MSNAVVTIGKDINVMELNSFWELFVACVGYENLPDDLDEVNDDLDHVTFEVRKDCLKFEIVAIDGRKEEYETTFEEFKDIILAELAAKESE